VEGGVAVGGVVGKGIGVGATGVVVTGGGNVATGVDEDDAVVGVAVPEPPMMVIVLFAQAARQRTAHIAAPPARCRKVMNRIQVLLLI